MTKVTPVDTLFVHCEWGASYCRKLRALVGEKEGPEMAEGVELWLCLFVKLITNLHLLYGGRLHLWALEPKLSEQI